MAASDLTFSATGMSTLSIAVMLPIPLRTALSAIRGLMIDESDPSSHRPLQSISARPSTTVKLHPGDYATLTRRPVVGFGVLGFDVCDEAVLERVLSVGESPDFSAALSESSLF